MKQAMKYTDEELLAEVQEDAFEESINYEIY
jgi:hypothetical protein